MRWGQGPAWGIVALELVALLVCSACAGDYVPAVVWIALAGAVVPLVRAARAARGTALRSAVVWAALAVALGLISQGVALREPIGSGRPAAGHWTYLCTLATLAALISVLNARRPGEGAWALLMALLVLVLLIPWLEKSGVARPLRGLERLRLESPWSIFYALLVIAGVTNYFPTRYAPAALWLALGFGAEYLALTPEGVPGLPQGLDWSVFPATLALALGTAAACARRGSGAATGPEAAWSRFRDHWGAVWALRVQERFNRSAVAQGWPVRLGWAGIEAAPGSVEEASFEGPPATPAAAEATLRGLLRRFADPERLAPSAAPPPRRPCQPPDAGG